MSHRHPKPPRWAARVLLRLCRPTDRDSLKDDLEIEFGDLAAERGRAFASVWYALHVLRAMPELVYSLFSWRLTMFKNYLIIALRNIRKHKGYSFINIAGLAAGMACCILIFLWVEDEYNYDRFHENADNIYRIILKNENRWYSSSPLPLAPIIKREYPEIQNITRYVIVNYQLRHNDKNFYLHGAFTDQDFFNIFSFRLLQGQPEIVFNKPNSIVITEECSHRYFGSENPIGKVLTVNNQWNLEVTGILENIPGNSHLQFDYLMALQSLGDQWLNNPSWMSKTYVQLHNNSDVENMRQKIKSVYWKYDQEDTNQEILADIQQFTRIHLYSLNDADPVVYVYVFSTVATIILLIACINFINLSTAKSGKRAKEIGMRKVVGAAKKDIIIQFYSESILLAFISLFAALLLVLLILPGYSNLAQKELSLNIMKNSNILFGIIGITLFAGITSGGYPAVLLSSFRPSLVLKSSFKHRIKGLNVRRVLVIFQSIITITILICTIVFYRQLNFIQNKDLGMNYKNVVVLSANSGLRGDNYQVFKNELMKNSNISKVSASSNIPTYHRIINSVYWEGKTEDRTTINTITVDYDYFELFEMDMLFGRSFSTEFQANTREYIINEEALKLTGFDDPLGKMFAVSGNEGRIIGVVKNFHNKSLHEEIAPAVFILPNNFTVGFREIFVKIKAGEVQTTIEYMKNEAKEIAPDFPLVYRFLDEEFMNQYNNDQRIGRLFKYFTILALMISCLGLYGMSSFTAQNKTKEIGVRKILGASVPNILSLISKEYFFQLVIANIVAWPIAYYIVKNMLNNYVYRVDIDLWIFILSGVTALFMSLISTGTQTLKAAVANPVDSLRYE